jgi:DNA (cytosine-5)-methyltransferase 1
VTGLVVDLFAGGGGASVGIEAALGRPIDIAINHNATALAVHEANHPKTKHFVSDIWEVEPRIATHGQPVWVLWASPSCTHFSRARSGVPSSAQERSHADVVLKWVEQTRPELVFLENVQEFLTWGPLCGDGAPIPERKGELFIAWKQKLESHGYSVDWRVLDSSDYGAPTKRRRLFMVARRDGQTISWPSPTHGPGLAPYRTAAECIDWSLPIPSIFGRKKPLAEKTLARIAEGIRRYVLDSPSPFLVQTGYGERPDQTPRAIDIDKPLGTIVAGGVKHALCAAYLAKHYGGVFGQRVDVPASTITSQDHHALTAVALAKFRGTSPGQPMSCDPRAPLPTISAGGIHVAAVGAMLSRFGVEPRPIIVDGEQYGIIDITMRMLEPHELLRAQFGRFAHGYDLSPAKTKAAQVRLIGNSVCPELAEAVVASNTRNAKAVAA